MRIAIPAKADHLDSAICESFGRAPYILLYNTVTKESEFLDNSAVASQGGAGIRVAQVIADHGTKALLTPRCGENAEKLLRRAEVLVYQSIPGTVRQNIEAFESDKLVLLNSFHSAFHGLEDKNTKDREEPL
ncbi:MAG: NifB/NifX family molybdenum-iron cluster-binding protein [Saccharofermentanales bacterium]